MIETARLSLVYLSKGAIVKNLFTVVDMMRDAAEVEWSLAETVLDKQWIFDRLGWRIVIIRFFVQSTPPTLPLSGLAKTAVLDWRKRQYWKTAVKGKNETYSGLENQRLYLGEVVNGGAVISIGGWLKPEWGFRFLAICQSKLITRYNTWSETTHYKLCYPYSWIIYQVAHQPSKHPDQQLREILLQVQYHSDMVTIVTW